MVTLAKNQHIKQRKLLYFVDTYNEWKFVKKSQNLTFKVNCLSQESSRFFFSIKNNSLGALTVVKIYFLTSIFETLLSFSNLSFDYRISSNKTLPWIIPATVIISSSENVVFSNKTRIWRLCKILIPAGLIRGHTVDFWTQILFYRTPPPAPPSTQTVTKWS